MSGKTRREAAKNRVGGNDRLGSGLGQKQGRERRWPKTEWAGMTD